jgi:hypothetical protein
VKNSELPQQVTPDTQIPADSDRDQPASQQIKFTILGREFQRCGTNALKEVGAYGASCCVCWGNDERKFTRDGLYKWDGKVPPGQSTSWNAAAGVYMCMACSRDLTSAESTLIIGGEGVEEKAMRVIEDPSSSEDQEQRKREHNLWLRAMERSIDSESFFDKITPAPGSTLEIAENLERELAASHEADC